MQVWQTEAPRPGLQFVLTPQTGPLQAHPQTRPLMTPWNHREVHPQMVTHQQGNQSSFVVVYCTSLLCRGVGLSIRIASPPLPTKKEKKKKKPVAMESQPSISNGGGIHSLEHAWITQYLGFCLIPWHGRTVASFIEKTFHISWVCHHFDQKCFVTYTWVSACCCCSQRAIARTFSTLKICTAIGTQKFYNNLFYSGGGGVVLLKN